MLSSTAVAFLVGFAAGAIVMVLVVAAMLHEGQEPLASSDLHND